MQIFDVRILEDVSFEDYLTLPGVNYSYVSRGGIAEYKVTDNMRFGSRVDAFLFEPHMYDGEQYELVRAVADAGARVLGVLLKYGKRQLTVMCTMVYNGLYMYYKGRIDLFAGQIVIDFKASDLEILAAVTHFGYNHQVNGYSIPLQAKSGLILSVSRKKPHGVQTCPIPNSLDFWQRAVMKYGQPI